MGCSSSKLLEKPNNPLQEIQYKESQRERLRLQQEKEKKQIARLQKKQAKKQRKIKAQKRNSARNASCSSSQELNSQPSIQQSNSMYIPESQSNFNYHTLHYNFRCDDLDRQLETKIRKQLNENLCEFILNQMALTIQFFKNYESELKSIAEDILFREKRFNNNLEEHSILLTNPLDAAVAKWINYKPCHGPDKNRSHLLQPQTMYVVFENIDIARPSDANYDSISPLCKVDMEMDFRETSPCKEDYIEMLNNIKWKGYVRLRLREDLKQQRSLGVNFDDIYSEDSSGYGTTSPYSSKTILNNADGDSEQDYDYAFISHLNTQHPLKELKMSNTNEQHIIDAKVLPESCVSLLGNFVQPLREEELTDDEEDSENEYDDSDQENRKENYRDYDTLQAIKLYRMELEKRRKLLSQNYLNSREFMKYFGELVRKKLAQPLQITEMDLNEASYKGTSIYTNKYELIPAIYAAQNVSDWPKCAFEFRLRERPISTNPQTGQQVQWPSRAMIKRIETFGFHVIPIGYASKKKRNPFREIEWRIVFPKAERYLEQHLTSSQVKVYMITKALMKSFVEPLEQNKALMFALDHLRMHLFWECEKDYTAWPEEFLGEVLLRFINSFKQRVKEKYLSDYFIRERNLFESIPEYSLNTLYTILADITANPVMHLMIALRNLDFSATDYFPKLNFKKLYENLLENDIIKLKMLTKNARSLIDFTLKNEDEACLMPDEGAKGLVGLKQHHVRTNGKLRRKTHLLRHNIELKKQELQAKRRSVESIDVEFFFKNNSNSSHIRQVNQGVENLRRTNILEIFLDHLLEMAAKAIQYHNVIMAKIYLSQARKLCKYYHNYGCDYGAKEYLASIHNLDEDLLIIYDQENFSVGPPSLPQKISMEPMLFEVPPSRELDTFNLYEEMVLQDKPAIRTSEIKKCLKIRSDRDSYIKDREQMSSLAKTSEPSISIRSPESRKSIKFSNFVIEVQPEDTNPDISIVEEKDIKTCLKAITKTTISTPNNYSPSPCRSPETRKSIKFRGKVITVQQGNINPIQKPQGYSPVSKLRSKPKQKNTEVNESENNQDATNYIEKKDKDPSLSGANTEEQFIIPSHLRKKLKSSTDFIKSSPIGNSEIFKNVSNNTKQFLSHMTIEEKKAQIREMLKRKTLQLKGAFNQSSDT